MFTGTSIIILFTPLDHGLIIHAQNEVRKKLEEVLPEQEGDIEGEAAYVQLTARASEGQITDALELVQQVVALASIEAGIGGTLINVVFTP